mgnify:CR=1 FL=1
MLLDRWIYRLSQSKVDWGYPQVWGKTIGARGEYSNMTNFALVILMMLNRSRAAILGRSFEISESIGF